MTTAPLPPPNASVEPGFTPVQNLGAERVDERDEQGRLLGRHWLRQGLLHGGLVVVHHRFAAGFLITGIHQRVEG